MVKEKYLKEDQDILDEINKGGTISLYSQDEVSKLQIKAVLRNRKSLEDSSKETARFSNVLIFIGTIQMAVAMLQLALYLKSENEKVGYLGLISVIILSVIIFILKRVLFKKSQQDPNTSVTLEK